MFKQTTKLLTLDHISITVGYVCAVFGANFRSLRSLRVSFNLLYGFGYFLLHFDARSFALMDSLVLEYSPPLDISTITAFLDTFPPGFPVTFIFTNLHLDCLFPGAMDDISLLLKDKPIKLQVRPNRSHSSVSFAKIAALKRFISGIEIL